MAVMVNTPPLTTSWQDGRIVVLAGDAASPLGEVETLRTDTDFVLSRCHCRSLRASALLLEPVAERPMPVLIKRLENEYAFRGQLEPPWAVQPRALVAEGGRCALLLDDPGGEPLSKRLGKPWGLRDFLVVAIGIASALGQLHRRGGIHKDVKPGNVLVGSDGQVRLMGFGIATTLRRERQSSEPIEVIAGTLAYMAPEQTGRMNRSVDSRSDLYSLGATFYELLTGELPFTASNAIEWVHCHVAREAPRVDEHRPEVPKPVADLVARLLSKAAESRYQTARGLETDLRRCLQSLEQHGAVLPFPLGGEDLPATLLIPERLYGREQEVHALVSALERVAETGNMEVALVSGYAGIGKSSMVNELHKTLVAQRGFLASGKFDQYKRDIPYATFAQALEQLVRSILPKSAAEVATWAALIRAALGANGKLIAELVPELEIVIGPQPDLPELPPKDAQRRFHATFRRFLSVFARPGQPLVLFVDDLQWLDAATLELVAELATHPDVRHVLLIGAYRDSEVRADGPLPAAMAEIRQRGTRLSEIVLQPLAVGDLALLIGDTLHSEPARVEPLAALVHEKTSGNAFFAIQFLTALADEALVSFDVQAHAWAWQIERIRARQFSDNIVHLMLERLRRLPPNTARAFAALACLGSSGTVEDLGLVLECSADEVHACLWEAVRMGLAFREEHAYVFLHDRVQEAAYALIANDARAEMHSRIGHLLLAGTAPEQIEERVFEIVNQLNRGAHLLGDDAARDAVLELNLRAGKRAKAQSAYASALTYLRAGCALLREGAWEERYSLTRELYLERAGCELLNASFELAASLIEELSRRSRSALEQVEAYRLHIELSVMQSENARAVEQALECLRLFGIDMPPHPSTADLTRAYDAVCLQLGERSIESLVDLPRANDENVEAAMSVLALLFAPAVFTDANLLTLHLCHMVMLTLEHGVTAPTAHAFGWFGIVLGDTFQRPLDGYRFARLARSLVDRHGFVAYQAKAYFALELASLWSAPIAAALEAIRSAHRHGVESGDVTVACYACNHAVTDLILRGEHLDRVWDESERGLAFARRAGFRDVVDVLVSQQRFIQSMRGCTQRVGAFAGADFDEQAFEAELGPARMSTMVLWYWIIKGQARFIAGDLAGAAQAFEQAAPLSWASPGHIQNLDYHYFGALTLAGRARRGPLEPRERAELAAHHARLLGWAETYPPTFADKERLVAAELARLEGDRGQALRLYEAALALAREHGFIQNEALANELCARFCMEHGLMARAGAYLRDAHYCYLRWGAAGKVAQLEALYPFLRDQAPVVSPSDTIGTPVVKLDLASVLEMSRAVSGEMVLDTLLEKLMKLALQHAAAERAVLLLVTGDEPSIAASAVTAAHGIAVQLGPAGALERELPEAVVRYVARTRSSVLLDDELSVHAFADDAYLATNAPRSVLCLPLLKQARLIGLLYLENRLAPRVFTADRVSVLELLASQAAISLENARLFAELAASQAELRSLIDTIPTLAWCAAPDGAIEFYNHRWLEYTGLAAEEAVGWGWRQVIHEQDQIPLEQIWSRLLRSGEAGEAEARIRRADGEYRWFLLRVQPVYDGAHAIVRWYGTNTDIEDRKRAEMRLGEQLRFETLRREVSVALVSAAPGDFDARLGDALTRVAAFFGADAARLLQATGSLELRLISEGRELALSAEARAAARMMADVLTAALVRHKAELELERADAALQQAQNELSRVTRAITLGELAASIAHEVNQPLTAISASAKASLNWLNREPPDLIAARRTISAVARDAARAGEVLARIRAMLSRSTIEYNPCDLPELISGIVPLVKSQLSRAGVRLSLAIDVSLPPVLGDVVQLQQVLLNLVLNAAEATQAVDASRRTVEIQARSEQRSAESWAVVEVIDSGTGIAAADLTRLFEPFYTTKPKGLGMGLSISRSIIERHHGNLSARNNASGGATFRFEIPGFAAGRADVAIAQQSSERP
jgi:PAS domain S-box-containing protein